MSTECWAWCVELCKKTRHSTYRAVRFDSTTSYKLLKTNLVTSPKAKSSFELEIHPNGRFFCPNEIQTFIMSKKFDCGYGLFWGYCDSDKFFDSQETLELKHTLLSDKEFRSTFKNIAITTDDIKQLLSKLGCDSSNDDNETHEESELADCLCNFKTLRLLSTIAFERIITRRQELIAKYGNFFS